MSLQRTFQTVASNHESSSMLPLTSRIPKRSYNMSTSSSNYFREGQPKFSSGMHRSGTLIGASNHTSLLPGYNKSTHNINRLLASAHLDSAYHYNSDQVRPMLSRKSRNSNNYNSGSNFDLSKYSPHNYIPNVQRNISLANTASKCSFANSNNLTIPPTLDLLGGNEVSCNYRSFQINKYASNGSSNRSTLSPFSSGKSWCTNGTNDKIDKTFEEGSSTGRCSGRCHLTGTSKEHCGLNGLRNIGNTCFMNSVIQCLSNTRPLLEYLLNEHYLNDINMTTSSMKGALIKAFSHVIKELWEQGDHVVNTSSLKTQIQRFAPRFMGYSQQDAQEFLRYLLEGLHEDVNRVTTKPQPIMSDVPDNYSDSMKATESWKRYLRSEDSTIVDLFVGQLRSSLRCTVCDHVSVTLDPFWDLSLPIPARQGNVKLSQCFEHFTREELLDGDEKPTCSRCQMRRKCIKSFSIQKFPKILVIHLKRFSPLERFRGKLNELVDFPVLGLELSAFAALQVQSCTYNLYGVANHSGTTHSGHYTAYCKHPHSGEWHEYNDSRVSPINARSVVSNEAYVLFYEQQSHNSHL